MMKRLFSLLLMSLPVFNALGSYQVNASYPQFYFEDESDSRIYVSDWMEIRHVGEGSATFSSGTSVNYWIVPQTNYIAVKGWGLSRTTNISESQWDYNQSTNYICTYDSKYEGLYNVYLFLHLRWFRYGITFNENGGSATPAALTDICYTNSVPLGSVSRTGYTFNGWTNSYNTAALTGNVDGSTLGVEEDGRNVMLYAKWTANQYAVTFNANASGVSVSPSSKSVTYDSTYGGLPSPARTGYTFDGWWTAASGGSQVTSSTTVNITAAQTLYAHWTANTYTVTLDRQSGSGGTASVTATYGNEMSSISVPTRTGYTFGGYYTGKGGSGTQYYTASGASARSWSLTTATTLYAKWTANMYTVTFNANASGVSVSPSSKSVTYGYRYREHLDSDGVTVITEPLPGPTRTGYTFEGWYTAASGGDRVTGSDRYYTVGNQMLYAHWTANTYTVTFNANGGSALTSSTDVTYDSTYGELPDPVCTGCTFVGWYTEGGDRVKASTTVSIASNHTLYAHWEGNYYELGYDNLFLFEEYKRKVEALPEANRTRGGGGIRFYDEEGYGTVRLWNGSGSRTYSAAKDQSGTVAELRNYYTMGVLPGVTYVLKMWMRAWSDYTGDAAGVFVLFHDENGTILGNVYAGVYNDIPNAGRGVTKELEFTVPANAKYTQLRLDVRVPELIVDFSGIRLCSKGGTHMDYDRQNVRKRYQYSTAAGQDEYGTLLEPNRTGYEFNGWYTAEAGGDQVTGQSPKAPVSSSIWSHWSAETSTVTFDRQGGSGGTSSTIATYGNDMPSITVPMRTGYAFGGYYVSAGGGGTQYYTSLGASSRTWDKNSETTLYAHWTANTYTVTFDANGGDPVSPATANVTYDLIYGTLPEPTFAGHEFSGWFTDASNGEPVKADTIVAIASDHTLYAQWDHLPVTVTFIDGWNEGEICVTNVEYGGSVSAPEPPTHEGYTFTNWNPAEFSPAMSNMTVRAKYRPNTYTVKYEANGGGGQMTNDVFTYDMEYNLQSNIYERMFYKFCGWASTPNASSNEVEYIDGASVSNLTAVANGTNILYAVWASTLSPYSIAANCTNLNLVCTNENRLWKIDNTFGLNSNSSVLGVDTRADLTCQTKGVGTLTFWYREDHSNNRIGTFHVYKDGIYVSTEGGREHLNIENSADDWKAFNYGNYDEHPELSFRWFFSGNSSTTCWIDQVHWYSGRFVNVNMENASEGFDDISQDDSGHKIRAIVLERWEEFNIPDTVSNVNVNCGKTWSDVTNTVNALSREDTPNVVVEDGTAELTFQDNIDEILITGFSVTNHPMAHLEATASPKVDGVTFDLFGAPTLTSGWSRVMSSLSTGGVVKLDFYVTTNKFFKVKAE